MGQGSVIIRQTRYAFGESFTLSRMSINGLAFTGCPYVLEDAVREVSGRPVTEWKVAGKTAIPYGKYPVRKTWSPRWKRKMWEICEVPGFAGIRPHAGNTPDDTEGCPLTGKLVDMKAGTVGLSRDARNALYATLDAAEARGDLIWWEVVC